MVEVETFLGNWRDSRGNDVKVEWAKPNSRGGQLSVTLNNPRSSRDPIKLDIKSMGRGRFICGHFDLDRDESTETRIVWADVKNPGKTSVWKREGADDEDDDRGRGDRARRSSRREALEPSRNGALEYGHGFAWSSAASAGAWVSPWTMRPPGTWDLSSGAPGSWMPPPPNQLAPSVTTPVSPEPEDFETPIESSVLSAAPRRPPPQPKKPAIDEIAEFDRLLLAQEGGSTASSAPSHQEVTLDELLLDEAPQRPAKTASKRTARATEAKPEAPSQRQRPQAPEEPGLQRIPVSMEPQRDPRLAAEPVTTPRASAREVPDDPRRRRREEPPPAPVDPPRVAPVVSYPSLSHLAYPSVPPAALPPPHLAPFTPPPTLGAVVFGQRAAPALPLQSFAPPLPPPPQPREIQQESRGKAEATVDKRLSAYAALLLGETSPVDTSANSDQEGEGEAPWRKSKRRRGAP